MKRDTQLENAVRREMDEAFSFLDERPSLHYDIMRQLRGKAKMKKKLAVGMVMVLCLLLSVTALAASLLKGHDIKLYEGVEIVNLLPDQRQEYDVCHRLSNGYLIGGFLLGDDYIAPMEADDAIVMLDQHFQVQWTLMDERLEGVLFDKVLEAGDALLMGMERSNEEWFPAIMKLDKAGSILWFYEGEPSFRTNDFAVDSENNVYCIGSYWNGNQQQPCILRLDADGKVSWEKTYPNLPLSAFTAAKLWYGSLVIAGYSEEGAWIGEVSADGTINWQKRIETEEPVQTVRLQASADDRLVLTVLFTAPGNTEATKQMSYFVLDAEFPRN